MSYRPGVKEAILDWGLKVVEHAGWETRGSSVFDPAGHVLHHDVIGHTETLPGMLITGRPDLAGPLCNFWLPRSGVVHLVAAGEANHAGSGGWNGLSGNASVWGTEMNNLGTPDDLWPDAQLEAAARLCAATGDYSGYPTTNDCLHKEWAPTRKIDPHTISGAAFRRYIELQEKEGLTVAQFDQIMAELKDIKKALHDGVPNAAVAKADRDRLKDVREDTKAIRKKVGA